MSSKFKKGADAVADDRNWTALIKNETKCADLWDNDWGFLAGNAELDKANATKLYTVDDKIKAVQQELEKLEKANLYSRTSQAYGSRSKIEMFEEKSHNIHKNKDLMPLSRALPKDWHKKKWKPPVDEFDPLAKLYKKK